MLVSTLNVQYRLRLAVGPQSGPARTRATTASAGRQDNYWGGCHFEDEAKKLQEVSAEAKAPAVRDATGRQGAWGTALRAPWDDQAVKGASRVALDLQRPLPLRIQLEEVAEVAGISTFAAHRLLDDLLLVLPDLKTSIGICHDNGHEVMSAAHLAGLLQTRADIASRLLRLRDMLPGVDVSLAAAGCNELLSVDLQQVAEAAEALAEVFWGPDGWKQAVAQHPALLSKDAAELRACDADLAWYITQGHVNPKHHVRRGEKLLRLTEGMSLRRLFPKSRGPQRTR